MVTSQAARPKLRELSKISIEAELNVPMAHITIDHRSWNHENHEVFGCPKSYGLHVSVNPSKPDGELRFADTRSGSFEPMGEMQFLPANRPLHAKFRSHKHISMHFIFANNKVQNWFEDDINWTSGCLRGCLDIVSPQVRKSVHRIANELRHPGFATDALCELIVAQTVVDLARYLKAINRKEWTGGLSPWRLRLIDERLLDSPRPVKLEELATFCNVSVRQLARGFRASRGCSIGDYIQQHRIRHAMQLLSTDRSIENIADELGFQKAASFSTTFRRATGESPRQYRDRLAGCR